MAFWLFKCRPDEYRLDARLTDTNEVITWTVKKHPKRIQPGDIVFLWTSGKDRGIRAVMVVTDLPREMTALESDRPYLVHWKVTPECRVLGQLTHRVSLSIDNLRGVLGLEGLPVKRGTRGTNFRVSAAAGAVLLRLVNERLLGSSFVGRSAEPVTETANPSGPTELPAGNEFPQRRESRSNRLVRDTEVGEWVKGHYDFHCQVCDLRLVTPRGPYAEAAHIHPLGGANPGPDVPGNVLCLCPNHHVLFDAGAISIAEDMTLLGMEGGCRILPGHTIDLQHLAFHRQHVYVQ